MDSTRGPVPRELLVPSYQNRLRAIGRQLDVGAHSAVNLFEVPGGFLVRAIGPDARTPSAMEFPDADFPELLARGFANRGESARSPRPHPLLPTGYEDFLRALGHRLDERHAEAITIAELTDFVAAGGLGHFEGYERTGIAPFQWLLRPPDIVALLNEAFNRRAAPPTEPKRGRLDRFVNR